MRLVFPHPPLWVPSLDTEKGVFLHFLNNFPFELWKISLASRLWAKAQPTIGMDLSVNALLKLIL